MKATRIFCVVAYDIADNRLRSKLVKIIEKYGTRINYSVFECMFTATQFKKIQEKTRKLVKEKEDQVVYYPLCLDCYAKIVYQPQLPPATSDGVVHIV